MSLIILIKQIYFKNDKKLNCEISTKKSKYSLNIYKQYKYEVVECSYFQQCRFAFDE